MSVLVLSGGISQWWISADYVRSELDKRTGDIEVHLASNGGDVFEGVEIHNLFRNYSKTKGKVTIVNTSKCMSIASLIFLAGDVKKAYANSTIMGHKSWSFAIGNSEDMTRQASVLDGIDNVLANTYKKYQAKTIEEIKQAMSEEMWYIGEKELLLSGFVDEIIDSLDNADDMIESKEQIESEYLDFVAKYEDEYKAQKHPLDFNKIEASIKSCKGNCSLVETPSVEISAVKQKTQKGATVATKTTEEVQAELSTAQATISTQTAEIDTLKAENKSLKDDKGALAQGIVDAKASFKKKATDQKEVNAEIIASLFSDEVLAVDKDTAIKMASCDNVNDSNKILIAALKSDGASSQGEPKFKADAKPTLSADNAEAEAKSIMEAL